MSPSVVGLFDERDEDDNVVGTRPIGIPAALRRLSGRVLMAAYSECMDKFFSLHHYCCAA